MFKWLLTSAALLLAAMALCEPAAAQVGDRKAECARVKERIRTLQSRMRQGYSAKQGVRMQDELRRLRKRRARLCR